MFFVNRKTLILHVDHEVFHHSFCVGVGIRELSKQEGSVVLDICEVHLLDLFIGPHPVDWGIEQSLLTVPSSITQCITSRQLNKGFYSLALMSQLEQFQSPPYIYF